MKTRIMNQKTLEGTEIFPAIIAEIERSKIEILVASAWFTDKDLFNALLSKQKQGIRVRVITAENEVNEKIDFSELSNAGGHVNKIKNKGYGMMHQKYCIIDEKIVIHGSYNWTFNARKNNQESVIITDHIDTVQKLKNSFHKMENEIIQNEGKSSSRTNELKMGFLNFFKSGKREMKYSRNDEKDNKTIEKGVNINDDFNTIISSEINNVDREKIKLRGKETAEKVKGNKGALRNAMDSLFRGFIADNYKAKEKKKNLKTKIDIKAEELIANVDIDNNREKGLEIVVNMGKEKENKRKLLELTGQKEKNESRIEYIDNTIIPNLKQKINSLKELISNMQVEFVKPKIKYFELIPTIIILLGLSVALFLFYSSSAYIMLYAKQDAIEMIKNGIPVNPQPFNSQAFTIANQKPGTAVYYLIAFVFIPFAIAFVTHKAKFWGKLFGVLAVIVLDVFVAYKVSDTIAEINFLSNGIENNIPFYYDHNLWIVFLLSAMPFVFFMLLLNNILRIFEARHPQTGKEKMEFLVNSHNEKIHSFDNEIVEFNNEKQSLYIELIDINRNIQDLNSSIANLPVEHQQNISRIEVECNDKIRSIKKKADLYKNDIDNDNIPISHIALKDRISLFLDGWNEWLYEQFAIPKADKHSENARIEADKWLSENIISEETHYSLRKAS